MENVLTEVFVDRMSSARFSSFIDASDGNVDRAIRLYEWNAQLSASIFELLGHVEVVIRNAIHKELALWNHRQFGSPNWFENHHGVLVSKAVQDINTVIERIIRKNRKVTPDRVVSELSFGFWRFLLAKQYRTTLWPAAIKEAFPNLEHAGVENLASRMSNLHELRNRIAHHEPIHRRRLDDDISDCEFVIASICEDTAEWAVLGSRALEVLQSRPFD